MLKGIQKDSNPQRTKEHLLLEFVHGDLVRLSNDTVHVTCDPVVSIFSTVEQSLVSCVSIFLLGWECLRQVFHFGHFLHPASLLHGHGHHVSSWPKQGAASDPTNLDYSLGRKKSLSQRAENSRWQGRSCQS